MADRRALIASAKKLDEDIVEMRGTQRDFNDRALELYGPLADALAESERDLQALRDKVARVEAWCKMCEDSGLEINADIAGRVRFALEGNL